MTAQTRTQSLLRFGPAIGGAIVALALWNLLQSFWQWPELTLALRQFLGEAAPAWQVNLSTLGLLLMNALWLGCGLILGLSMLRQQRLHPVIYYLCAVTLLFSGLLAKALAVLAVAHRLIRDAVGDVVK
ncbi:hypothetical protein [Ferrimonas balearica]|uniref:hypothetical protein n=1 Tax=Ferrimonas balearica TaxID=44012 RepID=UPI001C999D70|nr:hypothetical protein [Ferrimonas balearica]MBY5993417.1 hypothetical protein [Ferrimonas balearica]